MHKTQKDEEKNQGVAQDHFRLIAVAATIIAAFTPAMAFGHDYPFQHNFTIKPTGDAPVEIVAGEKVELVSTIVNLLRIQQDVVFITQIIGEDGTVQAMQVSNATISPDDWSKKSQTLGYRKTMATLSSKPFCGIAMEKICSHWL